ncbi:MAG: glycerol-3-phosphate 1-O-acyltransferase PlsY [bacterium]
MIGSIPTSIIACKWIKGIDIRDYGSRNAGATNVMRVAGLRIAIAVLLIDMLKGITGVKLIAFMPHLSSGYLNGWGAVLGGFMVVAGHVWTVFAGFKGGKGIGAGLGVFLYLSPVPALGGLVVFIILVWAFRYVSLGSLFAGLCNAIINTIFWFEIFDDFHSAGALVFLSWITEIFIIATHRANIIRLLNGTENRIGQKVEVKKV